MAKDPRKVADKWARRLAGATEDIRDGVQGVDVAPSQQAVKKKGKMRAKLLEAIDTGKWERNLLDVSLEEWRELMLAGIDRIAGGAESKKGKMEKFMSKFLPYLERVKEEVNRMPDETFEQRLQKMIAMVRKLKEFKR